MSIVLITPDLAVARYFASKGRIGVMYLVRMVELGGTEDLVSDPRTPYAAALIAAILSGPDHHARQGTRAATQC